MILRAKHLSKNYEQAGTAIEVLKDLNLEVAEGETLAITGQSGSGKTTLLSLLAGLDSPTTGSISVSETDLSGLSEEQLSDFRARSLGIVFQQFHLMSNLTALENVALPLELTYQERPLERAREALDRVGLSHRLEHFPHQLSGGEKQRVAIARAFVVSPRILLADEPSGNLDTRTGAEVMDLLFEMASTQKTTLILVTHNDELARRCQRHFSLEAGRLKLLNPAQGS